MKKILPYLLLPALFAVACHSYYVTQKTDFNHYSLKQSIASSKSDSVIDLYRLKLSAEMNQVLATSAGPLTRDHDQSTLGNFVCDALMQAAVLEFRDAQVDISLVNRGGMRSNLPAGEIKVGTVFELMPFENQLVLLKISGRKLMAGAKAIAAKKHSYYGLQLTLKKDSVIECLVNGKPVDADGAYTVVTSDYLANGGDNLWFLGQPLETRSSQLKIRDAIVNYCTWLTRNHKQIVPYTDDRLRKIE